MATAKTSRPAGPTRKPVRRKPAATKSAKARGPATRSSSAGAATKPAPEKTRVVKKFDLGIGKSVSQFASVTVKQMSLAGKTISGQVDNVVSPVVRRAKATARNVSKVVDPTSLGGAVAGLTAGDIAGGALGGVIGATVAGPVGAIVGAQIGSLAGTSVGVKMGYDVTHEVIHHKKSAKKQTIGDRVRGISRTFVRRAGDAAGSGAGALGGAAVGMAVGGPVGGVIGAFVGESFGGDLVENRALAAFDAQQKKPAAKNRSRTSKSKNNHGKGQTGKWIQNVTRDTVIETGASAMLGVAGGIIAGPVGRTIGERTALVAARRVNWDEAFAENAHGARGKPGGMRPKASRGPATPAVERPAGPAKAKAAPKRPVRSATTSPAKRGVRRAPRKTKTPAA